MTTTGFTSLPIWEGQEGEGRCKISLILIDTGNGIQGLLTGGEKPHIGGSVMALPRPSLQGEGWSSDLFITPVPGHKDIEVAKTVAEALARDIRCPVVINAGIHSDHLEERELKEIIQHSDTLIKRALDYFKS